MLSRIYLNFPIKHLCLFSTEPMKTEQNEASHKKSYTMPDDGETKYKNMPESYVPKKQIKFVNGRYLIYLNKQSLITPYFLSLHLTVPFIYLSLLIRNNPFYLTFPASLPIMFIANVMLLLRWVSHKAHFKNQVERIYLLETGQHIQLCYANKIKRKIKNNPMTESLSITDLALRYDSPDNPDIKPIRGTRFPTSAEEINNKPLFFQYGWTKRDKILNTYIIPHRFEYMDWEIMLNVMNGHTINVKDNFLKEGQLGEGELPSIEEQFERVKNMSKQSIQQEKLQ